MTDASSHWDGLHEDRRFRPVYPNEHVVRFFMRNRSWLREHAASSRVLDIGVGGGRHVKLAAELGFRVYGIDVSLTGLVHAAAWLDSLGLQAALVKASMLRLPFRDNSFGAAVSYGVFYYGDAEMMRQAIRELHRILRPEGRGFVVLRTTSDYRFGKGDKLGDQTFRLTISDTNEYDTVQHFLREEDINIYFACFSRVSFEKSETSFGERSGVNSDWLVELCK